MTTAAAKDAWETHEGRVNGQNDPSTGKPYAKPAAPEPPAQQQQQAAPSGTGSTAEPADPPAEPPAEQTAG